jgi:hypothetical protein
VLDSVGLEAPDAAPLERVIVQLHDNVADVGQAAEGLLQPLAGRLGHVYENALKGFSAELPGAAVQHLLNNPQVKLIEPDILVHAMGDTVPEGVRRIGRPTEGSYPPVNDPTGITDDPRVDVDVAIIDSGIKAHPDLVIAGGRHFYTVTVGPPRSRGQHNDANYEDDYGHGTHVAGTAAARDQGWGYIGVAPGARLWAVKVLDSNGSGYLADIIAGVDWVKANAGTIEVANMSLGVQGESDALRSAIESGVNAGIVFVVSAGNSAEDVYGPDGTFGSSDDFIPAAYPEVATISAFVDTDGQAGGDGSTTADGPDDSFASFSNYSASVATGNPVTSPGAAIDLMMPGVDVWSTHLNDDFVQMSGTSMASPHAAGLAALYIAENGRAMNADGVYAIRQALIDAGKAWDDPDYGLTHLASPDDYWENLGWAATGPVDYPPTVNVTSPTDGATVFDTVVVTADATDDNGVSQVEFFVDGASIGVDSLGSDGWSADWYTTAYSDGAYTVTATATDTASQTASDAVSVTVDNVDDPPTVAITNPVDGATVSGTVTVTADAADDRGVTQVEFFVDGGSIGVDADGSDGWSASWDTTADSYPDGLYTVTATATDTASQPATSDAVSVTVTNEVATMHVTDLDGSKNIKGRSGKWEAFVSATIFDSSGARVADATVSGDWSGATIGSVSGITASDGTVTFASGDLSGDSVTFTVTDVTHATFTYDSGANTDSEITLYYSTSASRPAGESPRLSAAIEDLAWLYAENEQAQSKKSAGNDAGPAAAAVDLLLMYT